MTSSLCLKSKFTRSLSFYTFLKGENRLRLKIRVPFQSLQAHISCQQKLQLASDVLRRTSRFVVLARRLQVQMANMNDTNVNENDRQNVLFTPRADEQGHDIEDEKERTIAKAALSIAELGEFSIYVPILHMINSVPPTAALLDSPISHRSSAEMTSFDENAADTSLMVSLRSINAVAAHVQFIEEARMMVTNEMENMVMTGLATLVRKMFFDLPHYAI